MRVTNKMITDNMASNIFKNAERLNKIMEVASSNKQINRPSDDPIGMMKILDYRTTLSKINQYNRNITRAASWLTLTESSLAEAENPLIKAKEIALSQSSGTAGAETRMIVAEEVEEIFDQVLSLANSKQGDSYIFGGFRTDIAPFTKDAAYNVTYNGDNGDIASTIGEGVSLTINATGDEVFTGGVNVFNVLRDLRDALLYNDPDGIAAQINLLDDAMEQILNHRTKVGAKTNRLEITTNHLVNLELNITDLLSKIEDADMAEVIIDLTSQQTAYQAALQTTAMVSQLSLLNFMG